MCFDGALGDIQVASDFSVVTSLEKQVDDLAFPGSHLIEFFFHNSLHLTDAPGRGKLRSTVAPSAHLDLGLCVSFCNYLAKIDWGD
jgi:hypothetical protein